MATISIPAESPAILPTEGRNSAPTTNTFARLSATITAISAGAKRKLIGQGTALSLAAPKYNSTCSGLFLSRKATLSPGLTPAAARATATRFDRSSSSRYVNC